MAESSAKPFLSPATMTKFIAAAIIIFLVSASLAQAKEKILFVGDVLSDTTTFHNITNRNALAPTILKSENKIEIRFITAPSFNYTECLLFTYNDEWSAKHLHFKTGSDFLISEDITPKINLDSVFSELVANNIFSLPDHDSLRTEKYEYIPETNEFIGSGMGVYDGICYAIEFKVGDLYRRYGYCNPDSYAEFYPHVYELRNFANIVELFSECLTDL